MMAMNKAAEQVTDNTITAEDGNEGLVVKVRRNGEIKSRLTEIIYFKPEICSQIDDQTNKCIKGILKIVEIVIPDRESPDFINIRKAVLDSVMDLNRNSKALIEKAF